MTIEKKNIIRYTEKQKIMELRQRHECLVGWGAGRDEFVRRYNMALYPLDHMIDSKAYQGEIVCGMEVSPPDILNELKGKDICFIIYPHSELEIVRQISEYMEAFSFIVSRLVDFGDEHLSGTYATNYEDVILAHALTRLGIREPYYVDIGVCHPVIRNNTYRFYEKGHRRGLLIEPNLEMCRLAEIYRPENVIVKAGACSGEDATLKYYMHPVSTYRGHNTFDEAVAMRNGFADNYVEVPVMNINRIFDQYCDEAPDVLDIDTEGMDFELLEALDTDRFRIKLICAEKCVGKKEYDMLMEAKGYVHFMETQENVIYIAGECLKELQNK